MTEHSSAHLGLERQFDRWNGFEVLWQSNGNSPTTHSILRVPTIAKVSLLFTKAAVGIDMTLVPTQDQEIWNISGIINYDIVQNLGLPVTRMRLSENPPLVTGNDIRKMKVLGQDGHVEKVDGSFPDLLEIDLRLPLDNIYRFLSVVWQPKTTGQTIPAVDLEGVSDSFRILPQKEHEGEREETHAFLTVHR